MPRRMSGEAKGESGPIMSKYDVLIIGAGPAGIFTALELVRNAPQLRIGIAEKGSCLERRGCPRHRGADQCVGCQPCHLLSGWGGAGAFSDGKLTLSTHVGGQLASHIGRAELAGLIEHVDQIYREMGAPPEIFGEDPATTSRLQRRAAAADLVLVPARIRHLGSERCPTVLGNLKDELASRVDIMTQTEAVELLTRDGAVAGARMSTGSPIEARYVVVTPGREGSGWFLDEARRLGADVSNNPVDIGVRVELPAVITEPLTAELYESKLMYWSRTFDDHVRTFCMCPYGEVVIENNQGVLTVNGHSYAARKTDLTNFALLVSKTFTEPFREPLKYGKYIASLANMLGGGVIVQRLGDLQAGRRTTDRRLQRGMVQPTLSAATPGDLSLVLPYRHLSSLLEMMTAMDRLCPGVCSQHTLLYGIEVKFYSARPRLTPELELPITNLFAAGDGAGVTRGLIQASASGTVVARAIIGRENGLLGRGQTGGRQD